MPLSSTSASPCRTSTTGYPPTTSAVLILECIDKHPLYPVYYAKPAIFLLQAAPLPTPQLLVAYLLLRDAWDASLF